MLMMVTFKIQRANKCKVFVHQNPVVLSLGSTLLYDTKRVETEVTFNSVLKGMHNVTGVFPSIKLSCARDILDLKLKI